MEPNSRHDNSDDLLHAEHLEQTLQELQQRVKEHEEALKKVCFGISDRMKSRKGLQECKDLLSNTNQLRAAPAKNRSGNAPPAQSSLEIMKAAYDELSSQTPFLPFPESVLPALLALRRSHQTVEDTRAYLASQNNSVEKARKRLEAERLNLKDQRALNQSLENRIQSLQESLTNRMEMEPEDIAQERIDELEQKKKRYDKDTSRLVKALRKFIEEHLAPMLAAEELGGPVVGDIMDIDGDDLAAGFSAQGRLKRVKENPDQDKRQRRIDDIWGPRDVHPPDRGKQEEWDETTAAATEMRDLTEELLNALAESQGDTSAAYVQTSKETAAARFLVRSKVAQFHPKDSTRLRLLDFGRELDD
jgi:hypothetical protein